MRPSAFAILPTLIFSLLWASFSTAGTVTDIDGNIYQTVTIGTQVWMAENLRVTHYRNHDEIPNTVDSTSWGGLTYGSYCNYKNDTNNVSTYGRLYNWFALADARKIAPVGWHVPTDSEWQTLVDYLGDSTVAGGKMKEAGTSHWESPNTGATNESGFSALPGGERHASSGYGHFDLMDSLAIFWSSTEASSGVSGGAWWRGLILDSSRVYHDHNGKSRGYSVRCVKDASCCSGTRGNVNLTGIIDSADLSALVNYLTNGGFIPPCTDAANVNGTGIVDSADLAALVNYLTNGGYVLPSCP